MFGWKKTVAVTVWATLLRRLAQQPDRLRWPMQMAPEQLQAI
jgi:hypothetical protein